MMRCDLCPAPAIAFLPGSEPVARVGIVVCRGEKRRAWCLACWCAEFRVGEAAA